MTAMLLAVMLLGAPQDTSTLRVQRGIVVRPETVTVGQHFQVIARVRAPLGATITFPAEPDMGGAVEAVDPRVVRVASDTGGTDRTAIYRLVAWDTGSVAVPLADAVVTLDSAQRAVPLGDARIYVRSVLPADTSRHVPKPARDIVLAVRGWWPWLLALLAALLLLALLGWWWWRRRPRTRVAVTLDPLAVAEREFARIDALGLLEAGERGRFVALNVEVMRDYLADRFHEAPRSLTSTELLAAMRGRAVVPLGRLAPLLAEADLVKFAARPVTSERAQQLANEARAVVRDVHRSIDEAATEAKAA